MRLATAFLTLMVPLFAQTQPDAKDLVKQSGEALNKLRSYQYESEIATEMAVPKNPLKITMTSSVTAINPDKKRVESKSQVGSTTLVSDGEYTWTYVAMLNQYTKKAALQMLEDIRASLGISDPSELYKDAKIVREESMEVGGKKYDCWVVETRIDKFSMPRMQGMALSDSVVTLWIAKDVMLNLQMIMSGKLQGGPMPKPVEMRVKMTMLSLKLDPDLSDTLFHFTPPEGAKEVADFTAPGISKPDLTGKPAPKFSIQSLDGKTQDLAELRGKVVLLDFWTTWCGPCRKEMPDLDKLHQEYRDSGLVLIGLNVAEDRETVEKYLKTSAVSYTIALTGNTDVVFTYQVSAFPTHVLIGRDGTIVDYQVGSGGPESLRTLLEKAGLKTGEAKDR
jgi:thiol-disulfide isomerase/thioredoxin